MMRAAGYYLLLVEPLGCRVTDEWELPLPLEWIAEGATERSTRGAGVYDGAATGLLRDGIVGARGGSMLGADCLMTGTCDSASCGRAEPNGAVLMGIGSGRGSGVRAIVSPDGIMEVFRRVGSDGLVRWEGSFGLDCTRGDSSRGRSRGLVIVRSGGAVGASSRRERVRDDSRSERAGGCVSGAAFRS